MRLIDWIVALAFLAYSIQDCVRRAAGKNLEGYFAGSRAIPWWAAGLSVMATQISAITVFATTGQGHDIGLEFVQLYFGLPFAMVLLCTYFVPLYRRMPILTAYEFLERRFGLGTRLLASAIFLISRSLALGVALAAPAIVLSTITGLSPQLAIVLTGLLTTVYTLFGGVNATIWMDVKQMGVIVLGLLVATGILLAEVLPELGVGGTLRVAGAAGRLEGFELVPQGSFFTDKYNVWSGLLGGLFLFLAYFGCDHSQVQRLLASAGARDSRKSLLISAFAKVPLQLLVLGVGVLMFVFFTLRGPPVVFDPRDQERPEVVALQAEHAAAVTARAAAAKALAAGGSVEQANAFAAAAQRVEQVRTQARKAVHGEKAKRDTDYVFAHFILHHLPPVILGLVIAAIFAAALSSTDSVLNALAAAFVVDFYRRLLARDASEAKLLLAGRIVTAAGGVLATLSALWLFGGESLIEKINRVGSYFYGSLLGVFVLGLVWPRAGRIAGVAGLVGGMASVLLASVTLEIEFLWFNVVGCAGVLATGIIASWFEPQRPGPSTPPVLGSSRA